MKRTCFGGSDYALLSRKVEKSSRLYGGVGETVQDIGVESAD